jgi:hypothetical protein
MMLQTMSLRMVGESPSGGCEVGRRPYLEWDGEYVEFEALPVQGAREASMNERWNLQSGEHEQEDGSLRNRTTKMDQESALSAPNQGLKDLNRKWTLESKKQTQSDLDRPCVPRAFQRVVGSA